MKFDWLSRIRRQRKYSKRRVHSRLQGCEVFEERLLLTSVTDSNLLFQAVDRNMWDTESAASVSSSFSHSLPGLHIAPISIGGFDPVFNTGLQASFSGGIDLGFSGHFNATGGEFDVDYQTKMTVSTLTTDGNDLSTVTAGEHFLLRASESSNRIATMQTEFANINAGLFLDYGLQVAASLDGRILGHSVVNTGFNTNIDDSLELIGAELNAGTGTGELRLLGGDGPLGQTWDFSEADFSVAGGILDASLFVPALNTGVPGDVYNDSNWNGDAVTNQHLPVDRSGGQTRIDFFKLGIGLDEIVSTITKVPLGFSVGGSEVMLEGTLIDSSLEAYLGIAQRMTFEPVMKIDYNFMDGEGQPLVVSVETDPGSGRFEAVSTKRIAVGQDLEVVHHGGEMVIDTDYVLTGNFRNETDIYLSPALTLEVGALELSGSLVETAQDLGLLPNVDFALFPETTFPIGEPIKIAELVDTSFELVDKDFGEIDGSDRSCPLCAA